MWIHSWRWKSQKKFVSVLENAGVYKMDDEGMDGFSRFVKDIMVEVKERLENGIDVLSISKFTLCAEAWHEFSWR